MLFALALEDMLLMLVLSEVEEDGVEYSEKQNANQYTEEIKKSSDMWGHP